MTSTTRVRLLASSLLAGACLFAAPAMAQTTQPTENSPEAQAEQTKPNEDVVVTGSRIGRPDLTTASPVNVIGQQEIQLRQPSTAEELIRDLPSVRPNLGPGVNNGGDGSASIDLRGIGTNRTLVLLDGRRIVPFGLDNIVDLNVIPLPLVERVDVVTGGASSVYGADAVAGVVNFITKRDFQGVQFDGETGVSERGDAVKRRAAVTLGANLADDKGNVVVGLSYTNNEPLLATNRGVGQIAISSVTGLFQGSTTAVPTIVTSPGVAAFGFPSTAVGAVIDPTTGTFRAATAGDTYNSNLQTYFQTPLEKYSIYVSGRYKIAPGIEFYTTAMFNDNKVRLQLAPSGTFTNTYQLPLNNPYLTGAERSQLCAAYDTDTKTPGIQPISPAACAAAGAVPGSVTVAGVRTPGNQLPGYLEIPVIASRRFTEYGPRGNPVESQQYQLQAGFRGNIVDNIKYDVSAQYGETTQNQDRDNWGSFSRVQQALRAGSTGGTPQCFDTTNGCTPINIFGAEGTITPAMLAFIDEDARIRRKVQLADATATISGDAFGIHSPLAETPIGFAIGGEYRSLKAASFPDQPSQVQGEVLGTGARTPPDSGKYDVKEVYGELIAPLVSDKSFFYRLQAEGGIRYSDYSTTKGSTTWKAGGTWEFFQGFKFRGMYQVAVRSPNIQELFQSQVQALGNLTTDPCQSSRLASAAANPGLAALCIATGAPSGTIGSIPTPSAGQINVTTAGNRNLGVEKARTLTLGGVIAPPQMLPGFSLTFDYFRIRITNAITQPAQADILNGCYDPSFNPTYAYNGFCQLIQRNPLNGSLNGAGETPGVILGFSNLGIIETAGYDIGVAQRLRLDDIGLNNAGQITLGFNATRLNYYHFQANPLSINRDCTGYYSASGCTNPRPKWKWDGRVTYGIGGFDLSLLWTHINSVSLEPYLATTIKPLTTPQPGGPNPALTGSQTVIYNGVTYTNVPTGGIQPQFRRIPAYDYFDLTAREALGDHVELTFTVNNLLDKDPPLVGSGVGGTSFNNDNTFPTVYDTIGRYYTVGVRLKF